MLNLPFGGGTLRNETSMLDFACRAGYKKILYA